LYKIKYAEAIPLPGEWYGFAVNNSLRTVILIKVTNVGTAGFQWKLIQGLLRTSTAFQRLSSPGILVFQFKDFPGFSRPVDTLLFGLSIL
jgi:hypothetical protein